MSCTDAPLVQHKDYRSQNLCNFRLIGLSVCKLWLRFADGENPRRIFFFLSNIALISEIRLQYFSIHADAIDSKLKSLQLLCTTFKISFKVSEK